MTTETIKALMSEVKDAPDVIITRNRYGYEIDGTYLRRVTTLCGGIPKPWLGNWAAKFVAEYAIEHKDAWTELPKTDAIKLLKGSPWSRRDDAGDRGTAVHNAIEAYTKGVDLPDDMTEDEAACVASAQAFHEARGSAALATELTVFNKTLGYAGTLDLWERAADGSSWILDYKTSAGVYAEHAVQQVAYLNAEYAIVNKVRHPESTAANEKWTGKVIHWGPQLIDRLGIVHVTPKGATLHVISLLSQKRLWTVFRAAAHIKMWQLDTDSFAGKTPRELIFDPVEPEDQEQS